MPAVSRPWREIRHVRGRTIPTPADLLDSRRVTPAPAPALTLTMQGHIRKAWVSGKFGAAHNALQYVC